MESTACTFLFQGTPWEKVLKSWIQQKGTHGRGGRLMGPGCDKPRVVCPVAAA